jgi:uncharacterized membrane protein YjgN (DUF898 family)
MDEDTGKAVAAGGKMSADTRSESLSVVYVPRPGLLGICLLNLLLNILTLTLYRFWARTNVRRHIWSCIHINGQPLEYTGRGSELLLGALVVFAVLGLPTALVFAGLALWLGPEHPALVAAQMLVLLGAAVLWGAAIFRARRYQLSRTLWRGIRGGLEGSTVTYALLYFGALLARGMTLGWSTPVMNLNLQEHMIGSTRFGDLKFRFKGRAGPLYPTYALCWVLTLVAVIVAIALAGGAVAGPLGEQMSAILGEAGETLSPDQLRAMAIAGFILLGLFVLFSLAYPAIWSLYAAREFKIFADYTKLGEARLKLEATAGSIFTLAFGNFFLWLFSLGIAMPFVQQRNIRYVCDRLTIDGSVDVDRIRQSSIPLGRMGEGLADAFDVGGL